MSQVTQEKQFWTNDEVADLIGELESVLGMMEPYYSQNGAGSSAEDLLARLRKKQDLIGPYFENVLQAASCKICQENFGYSKKGKRMDEHQQHSMAMAHIREVHAVEDYKERRSMVVKPHYVLVEFEHRQAYLDSLAVKK